MRRLIALPLVLLTLVGCGGSGGDGGADPAASLPPGALGYVELVVRPEGARKEKMSALAGRILGTDEPGRRIVELIDAAADERGSYAKDVEPWLGQRAGIAIYGDEEQTVAAVAASDAGAAADAIERTAEDVGDTRATYEDVDYWVGEDGEATAAAGDVVLLAGSEQLMRQAIDAQSGKSLAKEDAFKAALEPLPKERVGTIYLDARRALSQAGAASGGGQAQQVLGLLSGAAGQTALAVLAEDDQLALEVRFRGGGGPKSVLGPTGLVDQMPGDSMVAFGVPNVGEGVRSLINRVGGAIGAAVVEQRLEQDYGISLERDVYSWVADAAVAVRGLSLRDLDGVLVIGVRDERKARAAIARLLGALRIQTGIESRPIKVEGLVEPAYQVLVPGAREAVYVSLDVDRLVIAYGRRALRDMRADAFALSRTPVFAQAAATLDGIEPSLVVDASAALALVAEAAGDDAGFARARPFLERIAVIAGGSSRSERRAQLAVGVK